MAVRDDFTAGEVLAAADLNDTFGSKIPYAYGTATPSTTVDGFVWYDENETPPAPKFWDGSAFQLVSSPGGLVLVNATTFTSVTSINLDNIFTSDYLNYRIIWQGVSVAGSALNTRLRVSGVDNTAAQYDSTRLYASTGLGSPAVSSPSAATSWQINVALMVYNTIVADIFSPNVATPTLISAHSVQTDAAGTRQWVTAAQNHRASTAFDGYNIFLGESTTGTVRVYGYSDGA